MSKALFHTGVGMAMGLLIGGMALAAYLIARAATTPIPYRDVHIIEQWRDGQWLHVTATFLKTDCTFQRLDTRGFGLAGAVPLAWRNRDEPQGDRLRGLQSLRIDIGTVPDLDRIEIWVRHDCDGETVDGIFATLDPSEEIRPPVTRAGNGGHLGPVDALPD